MITYLNWRPKIFFMQEGLPFEFFKKFDTNCSVITVLRNFPSNITLISTNGVVQISKDIAISTQSNGQDMRVSEIRQSKEQMFILCLFLSVNFVVYFLKLSLKFVSTLLIHFSEKKIQYQSFL